MLAIRRMNTHAPTLPMHIQTDVDRLTRKIKFVTVNHGKSPFGSFFSHQKNYNRKSETCLSFLKHKICESGNPGYLKSILDSRVRENDGSTTFPKT
jgi:hypothetical protein